MSLALSPEQDCWKGAEAYGSAIRVKAYFPCSWGACGGRVAVMARSRRISRGQIAYHVMNRASAGIELFADAADYQAFERVLAEAAERYPAMRVCSWCLMPNHFHLVLWPKQHGLLPRFMQWLG